MNKKQAAALSTLAYLDRPDKVATLGEFVEYYIDRPEELPEKGEKREEVLAAIAIVQSDPYLQKLQIVGYTNNNNQGTKSGFVGYAFAETTSSKDGVVSFRGSETPIKENLNDWLNNVAMETGPTSKQMEDALTFMNNTEYKKGAGNLKNIEVTGHSLGGFLATTQAILDPRVTSATTFNAPGMSKSFMEENAEQIQRNRNKINSYTASGDFFSKLGNPLDSPERVPGSFEPFFDAHSMNNFLEGDETMENIGIIEHLQEILPENMAEPINFLASITDNMNTFSNETVPAFVETATTYFSELPENVGEFFNQIISDIITWATNIIAISQEKIPEFIESVRVFFSELPTKISEFFNQVITDIITWTINMIATTEEEVPKFIESIYTFFSELPENVGAFFNQIITDVTTWISDMITKAQEELPKCISQITTYFSELPDKMLSIGDDMIKGIFDGISDSVAWLYGKLKSWVSSVVDYIKGLFGIHSPSAIMRDEVGKNLALGIADGITKNKDAVADAMSEMSDVVTDSDLVIEPEVTAKSIDFETFKEKIRPSLDFIKSQIFRAQDILNTQIAASVQLTSAMAGAGANNTYNNGNTFNNHYTITSANNSPKATADAIKNQMTMQRMLFATR